MLVDVASEGEEEDGGEEGDDLAVDTRVGRDAPFVLLCARDPVSSGDAREQREGGVLEWHGRVGGGRDSLPV